MGDRQYEYLIGVLNINRCHEYINRCREYIIFIQILTYTTATVQKQSRNKPNNTETIQKQQRNSTETDM